MLTENDISYHIRGAIYDVFNNLGAGFLESVYTKTLIWELVDRGLTVRGEVPIPVHYKDVKMELGFRLDLLVEEKVIIEVKSVENLIEGCTINKF